MISAKSLKAFRIPDVEQQYFPRHRTESMIAFRPTVLEPGVESLPAGIAEVIPASPGPASVNAV